MLELRALQLQLLILGRQALLHPPHPFRKHLLVVARRGEQLRLRAARAAVVVAARALALVSVALSGVVVAVDERDASLGIGGERDDRQPWRRAWGAGSVHALGLAARRMDAVVFGEVDEGELWDRV
jgi:hypothetical protein